MKKNSYNVNHTASFIGAIGDGASEVIHTAPLDVDDKKIPSTARRSGKEKNESDRTIYNICADQIGAIGSGAETMIIKPPQKKDSTFHTKPSKNSQIISSYRSGSPSGGCYNFFGRTNIGAVGQGASSSIRVEGKKRALL